MNSLLLLLLSIVVVVLGYLFYSKRVDKRIIQSESQQGDACKNVYGWCGFHANKSKRAVWLSV